MRSEHSKEASNTRSYFAAMDQNSKSPHIASRKNIQGMPLITIAIPTHNRAGYLQDNINSLLTQVKMIEDQYQVEILVSDNCSTDDTQSVCKSYAESGMIRYFRNDVNLGPDRNFLKCINLATGKFVLLLGDDDSIIEGGLKTLLNLIAQNSERSLILVNSFKKIVSPSIVGTKEEFCFRTPDRLEFTDKDEFIGKIDPDPLTFMSSLVLNLERLRELAQLEEGTGTHFIHTVWMIRLLGLKSSVLVYPSPIIRAGTAESLDFPSRDRCISEFTLLAATLEFFSKFLPTIFKQCGYRKRTSRILVSKFVLRQSFMKLYTKIQGNNFLAYNRSKILKYTWRYPASWFLFYPSLIVPSWAMKPLRKGAELYIRIFVT